MKNLFDYLIVLIFLGSCSGTNNLSDGYGNFEATEVMVSAEANGKLLNFAVEEGQRYQSGTILGTIDTIQLYLKKNQLKAAINALTSKTQNIPSQINVLIERKNILIREKLRIENLLKEDAATQKQLDDILGEIEVIDKQMVATKTQLETNNRGILSEIKPLEIQIEQINDQINKSIIISPASGTVITKYAESGEITSYGKPLFLIANLDRIYLRVYVSGNQLSELVIGQEVDVLVDDPNNDIRNYNGSVSWISGKAEFTPKIVQTKEERVNLVYSVKVAVENDGKLKIGMPGEVNFKSTSKE